MHKINRKPLLRARDKEKDYDDGYKRYVSEVRREFKTYVIVCTLLHLTLTILYSISVATVVTLPAGYYCYTAWHKRYGAL